MRFYARFVCGNPHFHTSSYKISYRNVILNAFFSKRHLSTRLAVKLEQFLSDQLEIFTVSARLNYLQKNVECFLYVKNCSSYKAFSTRKKDFLSNRCHFFKNQYLKNG